MELISKISKGSKMDQIYIPKNRIGFPIGNYVLLSPLKKQKQDFKPYFYNISYIEPLKLNIINNIMNSIDENVKEYQNIIITGSFLDKGFNFNDLDIILVTKEKINQNLLEQSLEKTHGINSHIITLDNETLHTGLSTDPIYQLMLNKCISKKRIIYNTKKQINYKLLDLHLLKSKTLNDNYDILTGREKYYLTRNLISISLFLTSKKITLDSVNKEIKTIFNIPTINIKQNLINKKYFLRKYNSLYKKTFNKIMKGIKDDTK
jgi:hypothetical protein|tara:strand:- start:1316 stop:2104 length:789 start_codon:yes stop_codon:yes gene_type:complete